MRTLLLVVTAWGCGPAPARPVAPVAPVGFERGEDAIATDPHDIAVLCDASLASLARKRDAVVAAGDAELVVALSALDRAAWIDDQTSGLVADYHPEAANRDAGRACHTKLQRAITDARLAVFARLGRAKGLESEDAAYVAAIRAAAEADGAALPDARRQELGAVRARIDALTGELRAGMGTPVPPVVVPAARIDGLPSSFVVAHPADAHGNVTLDPVADVGLVALKARDRALAAELRDQRLRAIAGKSIAPLGEILDARRHAAALLRCASFVDCEARSRMVGHASRTLAFVTEMTAVIDELAAPYTRALGIAGTRPPATDLDYLEDGLRTRTGEASTVPWLARMEVEPTTRKVLDAIGDATGFRFVPAAPPAWPADATAFDVFRGDKRIARFVLDLYLRPGKVFGTGSSYPIVARTYRYDVPVTVVVSLTIPKAKDGPTTLPSSKFLTTLVHELGHSLDFIYERASALAPMERDFFDVPSQIAELWAVHPAFLQRLGLPPEGATAIAREIAWTRWYRLRLLALVTWLDLAFHGEHPVDPQRAYADAYRRVFTFEPEPTHPETAIPMPAMVYPGNGHALLWGLAISTDIASSFGPLGVMDRERWTQFFEQVSAGSGPAEVRIERFLHRPWSTAALREELTRTIASVTSARP